MHNFLVMLPILIMLIGIPLTFLLVEMKWNKFWRDSYFRFRKDFWKDLGE